MKKNGLTYTVLFTFVTAFFFVFLLSLANGATSARVEENKEIAVQAAVLSALGILPSDKEAVLSEYAMRFNKIPDPGDLMKTDLNSTSILVKYYSGPGLWGTISGILAVDKDLKTIRGLEIISHNETPGLGGRIDEDWFKEQFRNERIVEGRITVRKGSGQKDTDSANGVVDGITGASQTSQSVEKILNSQLEILKKGGADQ